MSADKSYTRGLIDGFEFPYRNTCMVHGLPVEVHSNIPGLSEISEDAFKFASEAVRNQESLPVFRIAAAILNEHPTHIEAISKERYEQFDTLFGAHYTDDAYKVLLSEQFVNSIVDRRRGDVMLYVTPPRDTANKDIVWMMASRVVLRTNIALTTQVPWLVTVHASSVTWDGKGCLLVGKAGQGKTTTALACTLSGASMLAEDISGIRSHGAEWSIVAMPSMPGLTNHTAELLDIHPSDITKEGTKHAGHKFWVPPERFTWLNRTRESRLHAVIAIILGDSTKPEVIECGKIEALRLLLDSSTRALIANSSQVASKVSGIAKAVDQIPTYKLMVPRGRPDLAATVIREVLKS